MLALVYVLLDSGGRNFLLRKHVSDLATNGDRQLQ